MQGEAPWRVGSPRQAAQPPPAPLPHLMRRGQRPYFGQEFDFVQSFCSDGSSNMTLSPKFDSLKQTSQNRQTVLKMCKIGIDHLLMKQRTGHESGKNECSILSLTQLQHSSRLNPYTCVTQLQHSSRVRPIMLIFSLIGGFVCSSIYVVMWQLRMI
eukprot:6190904-Amphidinium_carterae.1